MEAYTGFVFGAYGDVVMDSVAIGQASVPSMAIGVATVAGNGSWPDGVLGLGFASNCEFVARVCEI